MLLDMFSRITPCSNDYWVGNCLSHPSWVVVVEIHDWGMHVVVLLSYMSSFLMHRINATYPVNSENQFKAQASNTLSLCVWTEQDCADVGQGGARSAIEVLASKRPSFQHRRLGHHPQVPSCLQILLRQRAVEPQPNKYRLTQEPDELLVCLQVGARSSI